MNLDDQKAHPVDAGVELKRSQALELRIAGGSYRAIARQLGIGKTTAQEYVVGALEEIRQENREAAEELKRIELERLDALLVALWPKKDQARVADTILRVSERRARLLGLDVGRGEGDDGAPVGGLNVLPGAFQITLVAPGEVKPGTTARVIHQDPPPRTPDNDGTGTEGPAPG